MAKKKSSVKFSFDAPVSLCFVIISIVLFVVDSYFPDIKLNSLYLLTPTAGNGTLPFSFSNPLSYIRLFGFVFGGTEKIVLFGNLIFILLVGRNMEEKYGSLVIGVMMGVTVFCTSVLSSCFCKISFYGSGSLVFMMILLNIISFLSSKEISATAITVILLYIGREFYMNYPEGLINVAINLSGGICGSLFAFLAAPKKKVVKAENVNSYEGGLFRRASKIQEQELKSASKKRSAKKSDKTESSSDETVIGSLDL